MSSPVPSSTLVVGVAGPIGSGKTTLCARLVEKGAEYMSADTAGHNLLEEPAVRSRLVQVFGERILDGQGVVDRNELGRRAFHSAADLDRLNEIVHPPLLDRLRERIAGHRNAGEGILLIDAALIPEWGMESELDLLVHVTAPAASRKGRWCRATGRTPEDFEQRERRQLPEGQKKRNALVVVHNQGDEKELQAKAEILWDLLKNIEAGEIRLTERVEL